MQERKFRSTVRPPAENTLPIKTVVSTSTFSSDRVPDFVPRKLTGEKAIDLHLRSLADSVKIYENRYSDLLIDQVTKGLDTVKDLLAESELPEQTLGPYKQKFEKLKTRLTEAGFYEARTRYQQRQRIF